MAERQLAQLTSKIWELEHALRGMYREVASLEKLFRSSEPTHAHISVLPVEVMGMIFKEVVAQSGASVEYQPSLVEPHKPEWPVIRPELVISHVSRDWRTIVIGIPSLWTHIRLYVKQSVNLVDMYLTRSQGLPLFIAFRQHFVCGPHPRPYAADYPRITNTILDHMHLCRRLEIRTNVPVLELLEGLGRSHAPLLEEITLHHPWTTVREPVFSSSSFPTLAHLELGESILISTTMPLKNLTSLTLAGLPAFGLPPATFLNLLSGLPLLSSLVLVDEVVDFHRLNTPNFVELPSLWTLVFKPGPDMPRIYLTGLVEMIVAPNLQKLVLDFSNVSSPTEVLQFLRHLRRQAPKFLSLRHITVTSPFDGYDIANTLVHAAPNIEHLSLSRYCVDSVLMFLAHEARREAFPMLRTLQLESPHLSWDVLMLFLHRRKRLGRPLHGVLFKGFGGSTGEILDKLFGNLLTACLTV